MAGTKVVFRAALGGYNRKDVNNYIFNENRRFKTLEQDYTAKIDELKRHLADEKSRADELASKCEEMQHDKDRIVGLEARLSEVTSELSDERDKAADRTKELQSARLDADKYLSELFSTKKMLTKVQTDIRESVDSYMDELFAGINSVKNSSFALAEEFEKCGTRLSERISGMQSDLDRTIAETLAKLEMTSGEKDEQGSL